MRTKTVNVYQFDELSDEAKEKAIEALRDINVNREWWDSIYDDAENVGLKLTEFDLDRNRHAKGKFTESATYTAEKIMDEHGKECDTYKTAKQFLDDLNALTSEYDDIEDCPEDKIEELEDEFLKSILEDYSIMLQKESEYLTKDETIIETIKANEYEFTEDGRITR